MSEDGGRVSAFGVGCSRLCSRSVSSHPIHAGIISFLLPSSPLLGGRERVYQAGPKFIVFVDMFDYHRVCATE